VLVEWRVHLNSSGPDSKRIPEYATNITLDDSKFVTQGGRDSLRKVQ